MRAIFTFIVAMLGVGCLAKDLEDLAGSSTNAVDLLHGLATSTKDGVSTNTEFPIYLEKSITHEGSSFKSISFDPAVGFSRTHAERFVATSNVIDLLSLRKMFEHSITNGYKLRYDLSVEFKDDASVPRVCIFDIHVTDPQITNTLLTAIRSRFGLTIPIKLDLWFEGDKRVYAQAEKVQPKSRK